MKRLIELEINGQRHDVVLAPRELLVDVLRRKAGMIGPKKGCGEGHCGACTVLVDGEPVLCPQLPSEGNTAAAAL